MRRSGTRRFLMPAVGLLAALCLPIAASDPPPPPPGGPGGAGSAGQEFATFAEVQAHAGLRIDQETAAGDAAEIGYGSDFGGAVDWAPGGTKSETGLSGLRLTGTSGDNGIVINPAAPEEGYIIGGTEDFYQVGGEGYNTVIEVDAGQGNNEAGYEAVHGVGVAVNAGELVIENSYIRSEGPRSTPVYMLSTRAPGATSLVVRDSRLEAHSDEIWMPPFKLLAGGARASLLMTRNNSWFYNAEVISNNWGAISQDSVDAVTYVVNSTGMSTEGGYGTYLTYGMLLYGSELYGGQYGVFMCGESDIRADRGSAALADPDAMRHAAGNFEPEDKRSVIAAPCNAVVIHNSLPDSGMVAHGLFRDTLVSTRPEDLPEHVIPMAADDPFFLPGADIVGSGAGCGASYFFSRNLYGSLALVRSMNAELTFDGADTAAANGVLLQSVVTYDPPAASGYLTPEQGAQVPGISAAFLHGEYDGDILHQDYQRSMYVTVGEGAVLNGKAVSGTWSAWNDLWSKENLTAAMRADGHDPAEFGNEIWAEDVQANLIRPEDTAYAGTENHGISMSVEPGGTWKVCGDSSLRRLTISEGARIEAPDGFSLSFRTDCEISNDLLFYDDSDAEPLETLPAGTYENVVIRVSELTPEEPAVEETAQPEVPEQTPEKTKPTSQGTDTPAQEQPEPEAPETAESPRRGVHPAIPAAVAVIAAAAVCGILVRKRRK